jgi:hypothetical protein
MEKGRDIRILGDSSDAERVGDLQEMLKMGIGILRSLPTEWALLHHIDECRLKLKVTISDIHLWTSPNVGTGRSQKSLMHFRAAIGTGSTCIVDP